MSVTLADLKALMPATALDLAKRLITGLEGYASKAYPDPLHGWATPTIGYGTTRYPSGARVRQGDTCIERDALAWLEHHINRDILPVLEYIPTWPRMNPNQRAALISFAYNLGAHFYGNTPSFTRISQLLNSPHTWPDCAHVKQIFTMYRNPGSNVERGLRLRRELEADLFCTPVPEAKP